MSHTKRRPIPVWEIIDPAPHLAEHDYPYLYFESAREADEFRAEANKRRIAAGYHRIGDLIGPVKKIVLKSPAEVVDLLNMHAQMMWADDPAELSDTG